MFTCTGSDDYVNLICVRNVLEYESMLNLNIHTSYFSHAVNYLSNTSHFGMCEILTNFEIF